jgi:hypothetical protein
VFPQKTLTHTASSAWGHCLINPVSRRLSQDVAPVSNGSAIAVNGSLAVVGVTFLTVFSAERTALYLEPNDTTKIVPYAFNVQSGKDMHGGRRTGACARASAGHVYVQMRRGVVLP